MSVEAAPLMPESKVRLIFVTPEWMSKPASKTKLHILSQAHKLCLIAIDEAHLITEW